MIRSILIGLVSSLLLVAPATVGAQQQPAGASRASASAVASAVAAPPAPVEPVSTPASPRFVLRMTLGPQVGFYATRNGGFHYAGRFGVFLGHDVFAVGDAAAPVSLAVGYAGSVSMNHLEAFQRHGVGLSLRVASFSIALAGGVTAVHTFAIPGVIMGGHFLLQPSLQWSTFTLAFPFEMDFFRAGGSTVPLLALGISLGVSTN